MFLLGLSIHLLVVTSYKISLNHYLQLKSKVKIMGFTIPAATILDKSSRWENGIIIKNLIQLDMGKKVSSNVYRAPSPVSVLSSDNLPLYIPRTETTLIWGWGRPKLRSATIFLYSFVVRRSNLSPWHFPSLFVLLVCRKYEKKRFKIMETSNCCYSSRP